MRYLEAIIIIFQAQVEHVNFELHGHVASNSFHFEDDPVPPFSVGQLHVRLESTEFPRFDERNNERSLESKKEDFAEILRRQIGGVTKHVGPIELPPLLVEQYQLNEFL